MRWLTEVGPDDVCAVYSGPEYDLWRLIMGTQVHMGGLSSSLELANRAGVQPGSVGVDLCCCHGAGMQFLVSLRGVQAMTGVDMTNRVIEEGQRALAARGLADRIRFIRADAARTGLPAEGFDFAWGEDAWCYVPDKVALIAEAARLVRPGGRIAFTDWVEGRVPLTDDEARRFMTFMKFPSLAGMGDYARLLEQSGCRVEWAEDTGRFGRCIDLYLSMVEQQLAYDALSIMGFDATVLEAVANEMKFASTLANKGKLAQGMFVAVKF
jgi:ubiquinone/menaquinone biosynthesis C-methylase UbiE